MLFGYGGEILRIDMSSGKITTEKTPEELIRNYIGGRGFVAKILYDEVKPGTDPLGEGNKVVIATAPLAGNFVPGGVKVEFGAKSPATGGYGDSNMGGHLAAELKYAGYDIIPLGHLTRGGV